MIFYLRQCQALKITFNRSANVIMTVYTGFNYENIDIYRWI